MWQKKMCTFLLSYWKIKIIHATVSRLRYRCIWMNPAFIGLPRCYPWKQGKRRQLDIFHAYPHGGAHQNSWNFGQPESAIFQNFEENMHLLSTYFAQYLPNLLLNKHLGVAEKSVAISSKLLKNKGHSCNGVHREHDFSASRWRTDPQ